MIKETEVARSDFPNGGIKELLRLFFPLLLMTFSNCLFLLIEKLFLGRFSTQAMEAAVTVAYVCAIFQGACVALVMMAQVFVGRWYGASDLKAIGPGIWQFIWFSFLSMIITVPCSVLCGKIYFQGTDVEAVALPYFYFLVLINFLYPLGAALSCFYLGRGKTKLVLFATLGAQIAKIFLAYLFIFGWGSWMPSWGILGGAFSTAMAQGGFCLLLLMVFLRKQFQEIYHSRKWQFQWKLFIDCIQHGFLRALNRILGFTSWAAVALLMTDKGGEYLLVLSIGGALNLFLPFLGDAICQAQTTIVSHILGAKKYFLLNKAFQSGSILVLITIALVSIPLLFTPSFTFHFLFPKIVLSEEKIRMVLAGVWLSFFFFTFAFIPISYVLAFKDMKFSFFMGGVSWVNGYLFMYFSIVIMQIVADQFWLVLSVMHSTTALFYFLRMKWLTSRVLAAEPV